MKKIVYVLTELSGSSIVSAKVFHDITQAQAAFVKVVMMDTTL